MLGLKRVMALSTPWLAALFVLVGIVGVGGSVIAYRTYDWVEHDNDFCLSCHLMVEPYEQFAQSAHRDLGCKACHKPTLVARSQMGLAQFIENPDSLSVHAEVPNEKCTSCHIEGDPEKWTQIANSAGHRVHFESTDTILNDLQCVQCHSTGLHEFTATDQTCAQSGCHTDTKVTLGRMGDFTIHCVACHNFAASADDETLGSAQAALAPDENACMSCHVMRTLVEIPEDEPHQAVCSTCHNPHTQDTPQQAVESCGTSGCHDQPSELTPFHRGIEHPIEDCSSCHGAHDFQVEGSNCLSCHTDIFNDGPGAAGRVIAESFHASPPEFRAGFASALSPHAVSPHAASGFGGMAHSAPPSGPVAPSLSSPLATQEATDRPFRHATHRDLDCASCHTSTETHGALTVEAPTDCASCHHTTQVSTDCTACHAQVERPGRPDLSASWAMEFSAGDAGSAPRVRDVPFTHVVHSGTDCATCHTEGVTQPTADGACAGCHVEHHAQPTVSCISCHQPPPDDAHDVSAHLGCGGAGCHTDAPLTVTPREGREGCIACHTDLVDHQPEGACAECHQLPATTRGGGG